MTTRRAPRVTRCMLLVVAVWIMILPGCLRLGTADSAKHAPETTMQREVGELVKMYRLCLQKYEEYPIRARENCGVYKDAIRDLAPEHQKSLVAELMDKLRDKVQ